MPIPTDPYLVAPDGNPIGDFLMRVNRYQDMAVETTGPSIIVRYDQRNRIFVVETFSLEAEVPVDTLYVYRGDRWRQADGPPRPITEEVMLFGCGSDDEFERFLLINYGTHVDVWSVHAE